MGHSHAHGHDHHGHAHGHVHGLDDRRRLHIAIALTFVIFVAEVVGGAISGSLALLSDAGHMMTDVSAQLISLFALMLAERPADDRRSYGYRRLEILAALANGVLLAGLAGFTLYSAARRFSAPPPVDTGVLLPVAAVGLIANLAAALLLRPSRSINVRGAYLHIVSDALSSAAVIAGGAIMWWRGGLYVLDPVLSCFISLFVLVSAWRLGREAVDVLLEAVPPGTDLEQVRRDLAAVTGVDEVHDLHIWTLGGGVVALSAHVVVARGVFPAGYDAVLRAMETLARERHGIRHSTIQIESQEHACAEQAHSSMLGRFHIGGIPVAVSPMFILIAVVLASGRPAQGLALWCAAMFAGVLVHELGHAFAARRYGLTPSITLHGMGGTTSFARAETLRARQRVLVYLAGPGAGLALGLLVLAFARAFPPERGTQAHQVVIDLLWINLGWSI